MDDELNLDLDNIQENAEQKLKVKNRFEKLSENVILTSKERDEANAKAQAEAEARLNAEKERDFYKDFSINASKYPNANEYQDKIFEKVKAGYSTEDAMVSVLNAEGKLTPSQPVQNMAPIVEGGSSPTTFQGEKSTQDMNADERLNALRELDKTGELQALLKRGVSIGN